MNGIICVEAELKEGDQSASAKLPGPLHLRQTNRMKVTEPPLRSNWWTFAMVSWGPFKCTEASSQSPYSIYGCCDLYVGLTLYSDGRVEISLLL